METKIKQQSEKLESLFDSLSGKIADLENKLIKRIDEEVTALAAKAVEAAGRITVLEENAAKLEGEIKTLKKQVEKARVVGAVPEFTADAVVFGVPYTEAENLKSIFNQVCLSIDFWLHK